VMCCLLLVVCCIQLLLDFVKTHAMQPTVLLLLSLCVVPSPQLLCTFPALLQSLICHGKLANVQMTQLVSMADGSTKLVTFGFQSVERCVSLVRSLAL
jgi:uncharacterized membrane protein